MKYFALFLPLIFSYPLLAQTPPVSLIGQIPYVEVSPQSKVAYLNVPQILRGVDPLPDFRIPQRLPNEFLLTDRGRDLMARSQEANQFLIQGQPDKAVDIFRSTLQQWPDELGLRVALADSLYAMGDHHAAVKEYSYVLEKTPLHFQCLNNLAWLYATTPVADLRNLEHAEMLADQAKVVQPRSHHLWSTLSQIHFEKGEYGEAEKAIGNALVIVQQMQVNLNVVVSYLIQRDRCVLALQATSLLE